MLTKNEFRSSMNTISEHEQEFFEEELTLLFNNNVTNMSICAQSPP